MAEQELEIQVPPGLELTDEETDKISKQVQSRLVERISGKEAVARAIVVVIPRVETVKPRVETVAQVG